jgi:hypothetical protein
MAEGLYWPPKPFVTNRSADQLAFPELANFYRHPGRVGGGSLLH